MSTVLIPDYYYDDPHQRELHGKLLVSALPDGTPPFTVVGWSGLPSIDMPINSPEFQSAQVYGTLAVTLSYLVTLKSPLYFKCWSTFYNLVALPRAGKQLNAYYDRSTLRFFHNIDPVTKKMVYTCESTGIVAHELGHAVLDAMRPDLWDVASLEVFAFHEAFGDILAIASIMQHQPVVDQIFKETNGDLWQNNVITRLAEELGHAIYHSSDMTIGTEYYLRNAFNDFRYELPENLDGGTRDDILTKEPHNFSRIFSGAWYECFSRVYSENKSLGHGDALKLARDTMMLILLDAVSIAPSTAHFYQSVSMTMAKIAHKQYPNFAEIICKVLIRRRLAIDMATYAEYTNQEFDNAKFIDTSTEPAMSEVVSKREIVKVELPKYLLSTDSAATGKMKETVSSCLDYIDQKEMIGGVNETNMFTIVDGKLRRNYICSFCKKNTDNDLAHPVMGFP